ncbi:MAG: glycosyltransferase family 39 protein, partial [Chloroflexota bacterium]
MPPPRGAPGAPPPPPPRPAHRSTATAAALLLALAPIAVKYGQEARMHALFMFLSALSTWLCFRAMARPERWRRWLAFALATTANIYTMYFGFLILAAQAGFVVFTIYDLRFTIFKSRNPNLHAKRPRKASTQSVQSQFAGFTVATALAFLLYAPWWPVLGGLLRQRAAVGAIEGGVGRPLDFGRGVVQALGPLPEAVAWGFMGLFLLGIILLARRRRPLAGFAALWLALPVALPIVLGDPRALQFRYAFVLPVYLTVLTYAVTEISLLAGSILPTFQAGVFHLSRGGGRSWGDTPQAPPATAGRAALFDSFETHPFQPPFGRNLPTSQPPNLLTSLRSQPSNLLTYLIWILATVSFIATLDIYQQTKPDWRGAAAYLDEHAAPADLILFGPLWDEGRFIDYYFRGQAQLLTPAALVTNIERRVESLRGSGGRIWAVNRFKPAESPVMEQIVFPGVVVSAPKIAVYEPALLTEAALDLARQAVDAAYPWAAEATAQGVLDPDPRTARAAALRALGDALAAAGRPQEALGPYQTAVDIFPGWVNGFLALAETQERVGNIPAAVEAYRQAVA